MGVHDVAPFGDAFRQLDVENGPGRSGDDRRGAYLLVGRVDVGVDRPEVLKLRTVVLYHREHVAGRPFGGHDDALEVGPHRKLAVDGVADEFRDTTDSRIGAVLREHALDGVDEWGETELLNGNVSPSDIDAESERPETGDLRVWEHADARSARVVVADESRPGAIPTPDGRRVIRRTGDGTEEHPVLLATAGHATPERPTRRERLTETMGVETPHVRLVGEPLEPLTPYVASAESETGTCQGDDRRRRLRYVRLVWQCESGGPDCGTADGRAKVRPVLAEGVRLEVRQPVPDDVEDAPGLVGSR